jgi:hypothetical protein
VVIKGGHIDQSSKAREKKRALIRSIAEKAFWSYPSVAPSKISDGKLIEKVLIHGSDDERRQLINIYPKEKVQRVWERKLVIQEPRLHDLNNKLATELFGLENAEPYIQNSFQKHNLFDQFSE